MFEESWLYTIFRKTLSLGNVSVHSKGLLQKFLALMRDVT